MTQHTPGSWAIRKGVYGVLYAGPAALVHPGREAAQYAAERGRDLLTQRTADAALIAAAPDLLALCERLLRFAYQYGYTEAVLSAEGLFVSARETIAKAKGDAA